MRKGLNFCPTTKMDRFILQQDLYRMYRQICLKVLFFFYLKPTQVDPVPALGLRLKKVRLFNKSKIVPPTTYPPVQQFESNVNKYVDL